MTQVFEDHCQGITTYCVVRLEKYDFVTSK